MDTIISAVNSTQTIQVSENIKAVCKAIVTLKGKSKENDVKAFLETVTFQTSFEKLVAIKLIDAFKLKDNLISAFSTEDLFVISQSLKCDWFFEDDNGVLSDRVVILNFFSNLSYSSRIKVIRKYAKTLKNTEKAESLILLLEETYGIQTAVDLLPACSESFITDFLYSKDVILPDRVVSQLYHNYPDFTVDFIFSYYEKKKNAELKNHFSQTYERTLLRIASEKTALFIELYNKYGSYIHIDKFGRSLTHKILKVGYSSVLRNFELYLRILHTKLVVSYLSRTQIEELHFCSLPKTLTDFNEHSFSYYSKEPHFEVLCNVKATIAEVLLEKNFKKKYGKDPLEINLNEKWIKFFPQEIKMKWAERKLSDDLDVCDTAELCVFFPFEKAFERLKSLIPRALDINSRICIIRNMMESAKKCKYNEGASRIASYLVSRHRNDNSEVLGKALDELKEGFNLARLSVEQWAPILELINIMIINDKINSYNFELISIYEQWVQCRLNARLPIDKEMQVLMKYIGCYYSFNMASGTKYESICLNWFNENLHKKKFHDDDEKISYGVNLFCGINMFNVFHPECCILQKDWLLNAVQHRLKESRRGCSTIMTTLRKNKALRGKIYQDIFPEVISPEILLYKLNNNVADIANNVEHILEKVMSSYGVYLYKQFFQQLLLYIDLPNQFTEACLKLININGELIQNTDDDYDEESSSISFKENGIVILSFLNPNEFLRLIENYYPTGPIAESEGSEAHLKYKLQTAIAASFKNINPPYKSLDAVKKFSIGDYLKLALGSILSVSSKISQKKVLEYVKENLDAPISYRKHIFRIFRLVASKSAVSDLLLSSVKNEKNISLRIILFESLLDMIKLEKSEHSWEVIKQTFPLIEKEDLKQLSCRIFSTQEIPKEYQGEYIEIVWATVSRLDASDETKTKVFSLINDSNIALLSNEFADLLLSLCYRENNSCNHNTWNSFISTYLNYSRMEEFDKRLNNVLELIKSKICVSIGKDLNSIYKLSGLMNYIFKGALKDNVTVDASKLLSDLNRNLLQLFPEHEIFSIIFLLSLHQIFIKNNRLKNIIGFADDVCGLVDMACSTFGHYIIEVLSFHLNTIVGDYFRPVDNINSILVLSHRLITGPTSPTNKILGVSMLPNLSDFKVDSEIKMFNSIIETIKSSPDLALKIYAKKCLYGL